MTYETRVPVILKSDYTVSFERYAGLTFIHCDVRRWSKGVCRSLFSDFTQLCALHEQPIYAVHEIGDTKHEKFLNLFGFTYLSRITDITGVLRDIYVRKFNDGS